MPVERHICIPVFIFDFVQWPCEIFGRLGFACWPLIINVENACHFGCWNNYLSLWILPQNGCKMFELTYDSRQFFFFTFWPFVSVIEIVQRHLDSCIAFHRSFIVLKGINQLITSNWQWLQNVTDQKQMTQFYFQNGKLILLAICGFKNLCPTYLTQIIWVTFDSKNQSYLLMSLNP